MGRGDDRAGERARIPLPGGGRPGARRGWALAAQGQSQTGIAELRAGLAGCEAAGARLAHPYFLALLADACSRGAEVEAGLHVLDEAEALLHQSRRFFYEGRDPPSAGDAAPPVRRAGRLGRGPRACYRQSLAVARRQQARTLELRAATSLSQLWRELARAAEAPSLLAATLGSCPEGFTTVDYQAASALLAELEGEQDGGC